MTHHTELYDVIVLGAGPAGAMAAARLAKTGLDALVLDRARFPRDKPCGGGLTPKAFRQLDFDIGGLVVHRANRLYLKGPHLAPSLIETPNGEAIWMVQRRAFDARLVQLARERGAAIQEGEAVTRVQAGGLARVETNRGIYRARVVIGADGAESIVAKQVGLRAERNRGVCAFAVEAEVPVARDVLDGAAWVDYRLSRGYGWIFPKGRLYNIGVGSGDLCVIRDLRAHLSRFIADRNLPISGPVRMVGHRIPVWNHTEPLHRDNVILVGDAASLTDALWGEGISYALMSGQIAALTTADYLAQRVADLSVYTARIQHTIVKDLRSLYRVAQLINGLPGVMFPLFAHRPWLQSLAADIVSGDRSLAGVWRCGCALEFEKATNGGRCRAVLSSLVLGCCSV